MDYESYNGDSQDMLQQQLLSFLYNKSSWIYKILKDSNVSHNKNLLEPCQDDIVAIKLGGGTDFKMGVVVSTSQCPGIKVRTLLYGRKDTPLVHSRNLGLLYRDPRKPFKFWLTMRPVKKQMRSYLVAH